MDLNTLIQREGEERLRAQKAGSQSARIAHESLAELFRARIDFRRRTMIDGEAGSVADLRPVAL